MNWVGALISRRLSLPASSVSPVLDLLELSSQPMALKSGNLGLPGAKLVMPRVSSATWMSQPQARFKAARPTKRGFLVTIQLSAFRRSKAFQVLRTASQPPFQCLLLIESSTRRRVVSALWRGGGGAGHGWTSPPSLSFHTSIPGKLHERQERLLI